MKKILLITALLTLGFNFDANAICYGASNFGLGGGVYVPANPDEDNPAAGTNSKLLRVSPRVDQVAPWVTTDNDLRTTGVGKDPTCDSNKPPASCKLKRGTLKIYVEGSWFPWGKDINNPGGVPKDCGPVACSGSGGTNKDKEANSSVCFSGDGQRVDKGKDEDNTPCEQKGGYGLFGLIALKNASGIPSDPNLTAEIAKNPPNDLFRTFRVAPLQDDNDGKFFILDVSKQCNVQGNNATCLDDVNNQNDGIVREGKLYFQIKDRHYSDNVGGYTLNIVSGVYRPKGFIEEVVTAFDDLLGKVTQGLYEKVVADTGLINIVRAFLVFYVTMYGVMFMMGLAEAKHQDMIVRLLKIGLVVTAISPGSWEFFNDHLFGLFTVGSKEIASHIIRAALYYRGGAEDSPKFIIPEDATPLSIYDIIVDMLISSAIHAKIWGLIFYNGYFWIYIIIMYVAIFFALMGIIRAVVLYFTSLMLVAILLVTAPIFIVMVLFQMTRQIFENWLQQLIAGAMMIIVLSATMTVLVIILQDQIENLFGYGVCWEYVFTIFTRDYFFLNFKDVHFWYPKTPAEIDKCVTPLNLFAFLFVAVVFDKVMSQIPQLIDALSNAQLSPISRLSGGAMHTLEGKAGTAISAVNYVRAGVGMAASSAAGKFAEKTGLDKSSVGRAYTKASAAISAVRHSAPSQIASSIARTAYNAPRLVDEAMHSAPPSSVNFEGALSGIKRNIEDKYGTKALGGLQDGEWQAKSRQINAIREEAEKSSKDDKKK